MATSVSLPSVTTWSIVPVAGDLDIAVAPRLRAQLIELIVGGQHHLVIDLTEVTFIDTTGLSVLIGALKRVRAHDGSIRLVVGNDAVRRVLRVTGLHQVFACFDCVAEATTT